MDLNNLLASFANAFNQNQRFISLTLGSEAVPDSYRDVVDCLSPDTSIELKQLLGLSARLTLRDQNGDAVVRSGVVSTDEKFSVASRSGSAISQVTHEIRNGSGAIVGSGQTDAQGASSLLSGKNIDSLKLLIKGQ